jgi:hypothetical protein
MKKLCRTHHIIIINIIIILIGSSNTAKCIRTKPVGSVIRTAEGRNIQKILIKM